MHDSDAHFIPKGALKLMTPTRSVLITLIISPENVFQQISQRLLNVVKVIRLPSENEINITSSECNDDETLFLFNLFNIPVFGKKYFKRQVHWSLIIQTNDTKHIFITK